MIYPLLGLTTLISKILYKTETVEDQQKFIVPLNRDTEHLFYNQRMILDNKVLTEPRAWRITKVNRLANNGLCLTTLAQDKFDEFKDYVEKDEYGNVVGMWADYYQEPLIPKDDEEEALEVHSSITYTGTKPEVKIGGNYKTFTVKFYDKSDNELSVREGLWLFHVDEEEVSELIDYIPSGEGKIKLKFIGSELYIGKVLRVGYESTDGIKSSVEMNIRGL